MVKVGDSCYNLLMFFSGEQLNRLILEREIIIEPFEPNNLKSMSYTFVLGNTVRVLKKQSFLDTRQAPFFNEMQIPDDGYELNPGDFAIFLTKEKISLNGKYICLLSTRSTIAQMGLDVSQSSFFAEPDTDLRNIK